MIEREFDTDVENRPSSLLTGTNFVYPARPSRELLTSVAAAAAPVYSNCHRSWRAAIAIAIALPNSSVSFPS